MAKKEPASDAPEDDLTTGYWDNEQFIWIEVRDYERWIRQGRQAFEVGAQNFDYGAGADNVEDQRNQLTDTIVHMLHFARLHGLIDETFMLADAFHNIERDFTTENRDELLPWQLQLREKLRGEK